MSDRNERCESRMLDCGEVFGWDVEGVPLCKRCYDELQAEADRGHLRDAAALGGFLEDALEVADTMGMTDETVLPVWPEEMKRMNPRELTVGALRKLAAAISKAEGVAVTP